MLRMLQRILLILVILSTIFVFPSWVKARQSFPRLIATFSHDDEIIGFLQSHDGKRVLSWSYDRTARLWDINDGLLATMTHPDLVLGAAWSSDENTILTWWLGGTSVIGWNTKGEKIFTLDHNSQVGSDVWNKDSSRILSWSANEVRVWAKDGTELLILEHPSPVAKAFWNEDERRILSYSDEGGVYLWDAAGPLIAKLDLSGEISDLNRIASVEWSPDENSLLVRTRVSVYIWNTIDQSLTTFSHGDTIGGAVWNLDGQEILSWAFDNSVRVWDVHGDLLASLLHDNWVIGAEWSSDGTRVLSWAADSTSRVWSKTGQPLAVMRHDLFAPNPDRDSGLPPLNVDFAHWSINDTSILSISNDDEICRSQCTYAAWLWTTQGELVAKLAHSATVNGVSWNESETQLLSWSEDGTAKIWDNQSNLTLTIPYENFRGVGVRCAAWNRSDTQVLTLLENNTIQIWAVSPQ